MWGPRLYRIFLHAILEFYLCLPLLVAQQNRRLVVAVQGHGAVTKGPDQLTTADAGNSHENTLYQRQSNQYIVSQTGKCELTGSFHTCPGFPLDIVSSKQGRVADTSSKSMGQTLQRVLAAASAAQAEFGDSFVSIEHLFLALAREDTRFTQKALQDQGSSDKEILDAVNSIRGPQKVTNRNPEAAYEVHLNCGNVQRGTIRFGSATRRPCKPVFAPLRL